MAVRRSLSWHEPPGENDHGMPPSLTCPCPLGPAPRKATGFTLVEIMVVVVIIGLLAAIAIASFKRIQEKSENSRIVNDLRTYAQAFEAYALEQGAWPANTNAPQLIPVGMEDRLKAGDWSKAIPGGGLWDWEGPGTTFAVKAAIGIFGSNFSDARWAQIDAMIDDGNLNTGAFRKMSDGRPALVLEN